MLRRRKGDDLGSEEVIKRLDALIGVTLACVGRKEPLSMKERILTLKQMGLSPAETGRILGVQTSYVTAQLAQAKKKPPSQVKQQKPEGEI